MSGNNKENINPHNPHLGRLSYDEQYALQSLMALQQQRQQEQQRLREEQQIQQDAELLLSIRRDPPNGNSTGGSHVYKKTGTKVVLGKNKVIYKIKGSNKEYVRTKGKYVHITEYKKYSK
jgi:Skp family chaperone for outer membrane proteins